MNWEKRRKEREKERKKEWRKIYIIFGVLAVFAALNFLYLMHVLGRAGEEIKKEGVKTIIEDIWYGEGSGYNADQDSDGAASEIYEDKSTWSNGKYNMDQDSDGSIPEVTSEDRATKKDDEHRMQSDSNWWLIFSTM